MTTGTDFETIADLNRLQKAVQNLIDKSQERYNDANQLQQEAGSIREYFNQILAVHQALENLNAQGGVQHLLAEFRIAQEALAEFTAQHAPLSSAIQETLHAISIIQTGMLTRSNSEISASDIETAHVLLNNEEVAQQFIEALVRLGLTAETLALNDGFDTINALHQDLVGQQEVLVAQFLEANRYFEAFQQSEQTIRSLQQRTEDLAVQNKVYATQISQLVDAIQSDTNRATEAVTLVEDFQTGFQAAQVQAIEREKAIRQQVDAVEGRIQNFQQQYETVMTNVAKVGEQSLQVGKSLGTIYDVENRLNELVNRAEISVLQQNKKQEEMQNLLQRMNYLERENCILNSRIGALLQAGEANRRREEMVQQRLACLENQTQVLQSEATRRYNIIRNTINGLIKCMESFVRGQIEA